MWRKVLVTLMAATMMVGSTAMAAGTLTISGSSSMYNLVYDLSGSKTGATTGYNIANPSNKIGFTITESDSGSGIKDVAAGTVNIGDSSRELTAAEIASGLKATVICKDAVAMIVNKNNTLVNNLTSAQIAGIYNGTYTNWSQVGGASQPIVVYTREVGSGTRSFFVSTFLGGTDTIKSTATVYKSTELIRAAVAANPYAIGYISLGSVDSTVKATSLNGVAATVANAKAGTYTAVRNFNMVTKGAPTGNAQLFINWILTSAGQAIVTKDGEISL